MYKVPMKIPTHCNNCPFGMLQYSKPSWSKHYERSGIDDAFNNRETYGYVCNIDCEENGRYTKVMRGEIGTNIPKPEWCRLEDIN